MKVSETTKILQCIRSAMSKSDVTPKPLQAIIIPSADAHLSEYLAPCDQRRTYVSGFTGSAGTAVITETQAALWTDGRYFLQAQKELDSNWELMKMGLDDTPSIEEWLCTVLSPKSNVGINPFLYSFVSWNKMRNKLEAKGHNLVATSKDLVDAAWKNKPTIPCNPLVVLDIEITGMSVKNKISKFREKMDKNGTEWLIITALDDIAWLLNMRGSDIEFNPLFFSYVLLGKNSLELFINKQQITEKVLKHLTRESTVNFRNYGTVVEFIKSQCCKSNVWLCDGSSYALVSIVPEEKRVITSNSPVAMMKAEKNQVEADGMRSANERDAAALCNFLCWMESEVPKGNVTECSAAEKSFQFRKEQDKFISLSFSTISSSGSTGSIIHYSPNIEFDRAVTADAIYLCDSGAHYMDGTTDTTRTTHFGTPTAYEKECFTRVLKGHIAVAQSVFPVGTKGYMLDTLARMHLWKAGLDYMHGTGHGVGTFLNVHEGPVGIYIGNSGRVVEAASETSLKPGMVITDEPGYYEDGKFGIRIENALLCVEAKTEYNFGGKKYLKFEPLAYIPIQKKMIEKSLLSEDEIQWLNWYHTECNKKIGKVLKEQGSTKTYEWLEEQTKLL